MSVKLRVRLFASVLLAFSWGLGRFVHPAWLWISVFIGINILQSAFTGFCPFTTLFTAMSRKKD
jgi:hypothetical protein